MKIFDSGLFDNNCVARRASTVVHSCEMDRQLDWSNLLSIKRLRDLVGERPSLRSPKDLRDEFERDYGRTIYSNPFRRLRDKAQVFPLERHDAVRTRLTHSQEVSSVAEDLASQVVREIIVKKEKILDAEQRAIPLIAAVCGLVHDIGNPPFGHAGELAISTWFEKKGNLLKQLGGSGSQMAKDFSAFEGNAQAFRILSHMFLLADEWGLNFTAATLSATAKYLASSDIAGQDPLKHELSKAGFFKSEAEIFQLVRQETSTKGVRHPLTYLVEAADDIVYCVVDLEDGIKKEVLDWPSVEPKLKELSGNAQIFQDACQRAREQIGPAKLGGRAYQEAMAQAFRTALISEMVPAVVRIFGKRYDSIMGGEYHNELLFDPECDAAPVAEAAKTVLRDDLYACPDILQLEIRGRKVIHDLMDLFWEAVSKFDGGLTTKTYEGKLYLLISENYRRVFERRWRENKEHLLYCKLQLVTDQVAGMTDTYACHLHKELSNG